MVKAWEVVDILDEIYEKNFGRKKSGRFKISKSLFRELCGRKHLRESFMNDVIEEGLEAGIVIIPLEHVVVVVKEDVLTNCRFVPDDIVAEYVEENDDDWKEVEILEEKEIEEEE